MKRLNGIHLRHLKNTQDMKTVKLPLPDRVTILMSQNMGAECSPLVAIGEKVTVGQKIGDSSAFMSAPVHSSVSGTVV
ncbi:MAG: electron transport complex subunit RsxC, partial [Oscillospiraceae bacterium]|nr:electron transport complex subunit RsxC [Oscillospiraceae bacterium]